MNPATQPAGRHNYGNGLALIVAASGARSWSCRVTVGGQQRSFGLGAWPGVDEQVARAAMAAQRAALGVLPRATAPVPTLLEPVQHPPATPVLPPAPTSGNGTFGAYAERLAAYKYATSKRERDAVAWGGFVRSYCAALYPVQVVDITAVRILDDVAEPAREGGPARVCNGATVPELRGGTTRPERVLTVVAEVLRGAVLDRTILHNPAEGSTIRDGLRQRLPAHRQNPYAAPEASAVPAIAAALRDLHRPASAAVLLALLTGCRRDEAREATWGEFDFTSAPTWTIPAARMKAGDEHRIPLSRQALAVVNGQRLRAAAVDAIWVFGARDGGAVSKDAVQYARKVAAPGVTIHGLRVAFRCWAADAGVPHEVAEACVSHKFGSMTVRAYQRSDLLERRRPVMAAWADYVMPQ